MVYKYDIIDKKNVSNVRFLISTLVTRNLGYLFWASTTNIFSQIICVNASFR